MTRNVIVTGASRGIGLELVRQLSARADTRVFAGCRRPETAAALQQISKERHNVEVLALDVSDASSITDCLRHVASQVSSLSLVINNAGINSERQPHDWVSTASAAEAIDIYRTNVVGPLLVTQQALPLLRASASAASHSACPSRPPVVVNISSTFASLSLNDDGNNALYKLSKAALNQLTVCFAREDESVVSVALSPGWVQTAMGTKGGRRPPLTPERSVSGLLSVIDGLRLQDSGKFLEYDGSQLPW